MNKRALMLMANMNKSEKGRRVGVEYEDWGVRDNYPMIDPYSGGYGPYGGHYAMDRSLRDRRIQEQYDADRRSTIMEPESRGYRRYSNGRFAPRNDYNDPWMDHKMPPTYDDRGERKMNPIGFARDMSGSDATVPQYHEMERMDGDGMARGYSKSEYSPQFDKRMAEEWAANMENEDGTRGPHWTLDQAKQVMAQKEIGGSPWAFYMALNMIYSDYCKVAKKLGVNSVDFYACMAEAFLNDKDAVGGGGTEKLAAYYNTVVQH